LKIRDVEAGSSARFEAGVAGITPMASRLLTAD
jgi:hypothetical protein